MRVCTTIGVRYGETDMMGVVYHANYLLYFEDAREAFLNAIGFSYADIEKAGYMSPVVSAELNYREPLRYGERAIVRTRVTESRSTRTTYACEVFREGQDMDAEKPLVTAKTVLCIVDRDTFKPVSIKRALPELYAKYQEVIEPEE